MYINILRLFQRIVTEALSGKQDVEVSKANQILKHVSDVLTQEAPAQSRNVRGLDLEKIVTITKGAVGVADDILDDHKEEARHHTVEEWLKTIDGRLETMQNGLTTVEQIVIEARDCCCAQHQQDYQEPATQEYSAQSEPAHTESSGQGGAQPHQGESAQPAQPAQPEKPGKPSKPSKPDKPKKPKKDGPIKGEGMGKGKGAGKNPDKGHMGETPKGHQQKG